MFYRELVIFVWVNVRMKLIKVVFFVFLINFGKIVVFFGEVFEKGGSW